LIASFFLSLASGTGAALGWCFAGSRTLPRLLGFAESAAAWRGYSTEAQILPHTPRGTPSQFLHCALRTNRLEDPRVLDVVVSDISGEDVHAFSVHESEDLAPTMGFVRRADAFIVMLDCVRLFRAEPSDGEVVGPGYDGLVSEVLLMVRNQLSARRAGLAIPVALVWSKFDTIAAHVTPPSDAKTIAPGDWGLLGVHARRTLHALSEIAQDGVPVTAHAVSAFPTPLQHAPAYNVWAPFVAAISPKNDRARPGGEARVLPDAVVHPFMAVTRLENS
jgi:hypothetical protein